jgi:transposase
MEPIYTSCCGLDVHKKSVRACVRRIGQDGKIQYEIRGFGTMTRDIRDLADWLSREEVTHVAMESTGVYWKPIYNTLEGRFNILLVNARTLRMFPEERPTSRTANGLRSFSNVGFLN